MNYLVGVARLRQLSQQISEDNDNNVSILRRQCKEQWRARPTESQGNMIMAESNGTWLDLLFSSLLMLSLGKWRIKLESGGYGCSFVFIETKAT